ncbi:hypothetical protein RB2501_00346 [Robiginitalea biformata HTCC2501]|uniref:PKD domain-containing protein n=2 Tax=Robiginitalea TaxID=252306 RepID=A4CNL2_ROBBH|nr:hypothetical protein RB2501_00346 [Robiginitalea biformata HTCC2501]
MNMNRSRWITCLALFFYGFGIVLGQKEAAVWYFGQYAGLDFSSGEPVALFDGLVNTVEGCDAYSDADGNLLFYTDGISVWDRNHQQMDGGNGLAGSPSTSQAAVVVPLPGSETIFYIFTPDDALAYAGGLAGSTPNGLNYSVVDMSRNGGLGAVVRRNVPLLASASENITAVRNQGDDFYWVVTHRRDRFFAYRLTASGLDPDPVVTLLGPDTRLPANFRGCAKISPDGTRLAIAHTIVEPGIESQLFLYDFDAGTGRVANPRALGGDLLFYGVEFSPDSSKLYATGTLIGGETSDLFLETEIVEILQFNLTTADIPASRYRVHRFERPIQGFIGGSIQLAVDRRIYHSMPGRELSVIRNPEAAGNACDFRPFDTNLGGPAATYGLPQFIQSYFETVVEVEPLCFGSTAQFTPDGAGDIAAISWDFGDPASGSRNFSDQILPGHQYSSPGVYEVRFDVTYRNGTRREFLQFVEIADVPDPPATVELLQCDIDGDDDGLAEFNLGEALPALQGGNPEINAFYYLSREDAEINRNPLNPVGFANTIPDQVVYARVFETPDCFRISEIELQTRFLEIPEAAVMTVCQVTSGESTAGLKREEMEAFLSGLYGASGNLTLHATRSDALLSQRAFFNYNIRFQPGSPRVVWFRIEDGGGCGQIGSVQVHFVTPPDLDGFVEMSYCNSPVVLEAPEVFSEYLWDDGSTGRVRTVDAPGSYSVALRVGECEQVQEFRVLPPQTLQISEVIVSDFRQVNSVRVMVGGSESAVSFSLDGGLNFQESPFFGGLKPGVYELVVQGTCQTLSREIAVGGLPNFFTPNGDGKNDRWEFHNAAYFGPYQLQIYDRFGNLVGQMSDSDPGWDGNRMGSPLPASDYWYRLHLETGREVTGHFALIR